MSRPFDWTPLAVGDPIPGDPDTVERAGRDYARIAHAIEIAAARLRDIASNADMQSDAVAAIRTRAEELAGQISRAQHRYEAMGSALTRYALTLTDAQAASIRALNAARDAWADQAMASRLFAAAQCQIDIAAPWTDTTPHLISLTDAQRREAAAADRLATARTMLDRAVQDRDEGAEAARRIIDAAKSADHLNDSRWANIKHGIVETLTAVAEVVDMIAVGAGILALVFAWVPFLGEFLAAVALIASIASLALKLTLKAFGEGSWRDIAWAAVGVAAFGVGKVAVGEANAAAKGAQLGSRLLTGGAAESSAIRAAASLPSAATDTATVNAAMRSAGAFGHGGAASAIADSTRAGAFWGRAAESLRAIPDEVAEDFAGIRNFDVQHPFTQVRAETPRHLMSLLGERSAAGESLELAGLPDGLRGAPLVLGPTIVHHASTGAFILTWLGGDALLSKDTWGLVREHL